MHLNLSEPILVATNNAGKVQDISDLFAEIGLSILTGRDFLLPSPPEAEDTLEGNARIKAKAAVEATGRTVMSDDSGFFVEALNGAPGVFAADCAETPSGRDYAVARAKVWAAVSSTLRDGDVARACFRTVWLILTPEGEEAVFTGEVSGILVWPPRGEQGHDFDSMFMPDGSDRTFGEMSASEKNRFRITSGSPLFQQWGGIEEKTRQRLEFSSFLSYEFCMDAGRNRNVIDDDKDHVACAPKDRRAVLVHPVKTRKGR